MDGALRLLSSRFKIQSVTHRGGSMAMLSSRDGGHVLRFLLLALDDVSGVLAIKISQTTAEFSASEAPPDRHQLTELPEFPASTPTFYVHDKDSKMAVQTATTFAGCGEASAFYRQELRGAGWAPSPPDEDPRRAMHLYHKGPHIACVMVLPDTESNGSTITLLHKTLQVK